MRGSASTTCSRNSTSPAASTAAETPAVAHTPPAATARRVRRRSCTCARNALETGAAGAVAAGPAAGFSSSGAGSAGAGAARQLPPQEAQRTVRPLAGTASSATK